MNGGQGQRSGSGKATELRSGTGGSARSHTTSALGPHEWRYNIGVSVGPHDSEQHNENDRRHHRHAIYATETAGLLLIAFLLLAITIIRYWHAMHWSLR